MSSIAVPTPGYATELLLLKNEMSQLREIITTAMEQIKQAFASFPVPHHTTEQIAMETKEKDSVHSAAASTPDGDTPKCLALPDIIRNLKNDIASISHKTCAMIKQCTPQWPKIDHAMEITPEISDLIDKLKHDIAAVAIEMQAKFKQQAIVTSTLQTHWTSGP